MKPKKPLYMHIIDSLKGKISSGEFVVDGQLPTEIELADEYKVSRITSKRALSELERDGLIYRIRGKGSFVKPSPPIQAPPTPHSNEMDRMISMILPFNSSQNRLMDYIKGATEFLNPRGYYLSIHTTKDSMDEEREILRNLSKHGIKSAIFYPLSDRNYYEELNTLCLNDFPFVTIDKYFEGLPLSYVVSDNFNGGYLVCSYLLTLHHRRIAYVSNVSLESATSVRDRYYGYTKALKDNGLQIDSDIIRIECFHEIKEDERREQCKKMIMELLQQGVTAIQAENDLTAIEILLCCMEMGIKVPDELSIVGFDDTEIAKHLEIPLTTVAQDFSGIGSKAAEIIVAKLEKSETEVKRNVLPVKLIERQSSASVKQKGVRASNGN